MAYRVLIVGSAERSTDAVAILESGGYAETTLASGRADTLRAAKETNPDVVLLDVGLEDDPLGLMKEILLERPTAVVVNASYSQVGAVKEAEEMGAAAHVFRPFTKEALISAVELGASRFRQCQALHAEIGECRETLRVRKLVERAKGILMKRNAISEEEAFISIQKLSRDNNLPMEKVAESIITASKLM